jgi:hypothetical protein
MVHVEDVCGRGAVLRRNERIRAGVESEAIEDNTGCESGCTDLARLEYNLTDLALLPKLPLAGFENGILRRVGQERRKANALGPNL